MISFFAILGASFKLVPFLPLTWISLAILKPLIYLKKSLDEKYLNYTCVFLLYNCILCIINFSSLNHEETIKSFINILLFSLVLSFKNDYFHLKNYIIESLSFLIFTYALVQFVFANFYDYPDIFYFFDGLSISTMDNYARNEAVNFLGTLRASSFFHEPSYLALICLILFYLSDNLLVKTTNIICIFLSISTIGIFFLLLHLIFMLKKNIRYPLLVFFFILLSYNLEIIRLNEILQPGTSGYVRLVEPILSFFQYLVYYPMGTPVGNVFPQSNNSFFLFFSYYPLLVPLLIFLLYKKSYRFIMLSILFTNGAFFTIDGALLFKFLVSNEKHYNNNMS